MRQALHIFAKDTRRLWPQIAAVVALFAAYAFLSPETELNNSASLLEWNGLPAALVVLACWMLGASAIHEDGPAQQSPFWLTRPYERTSLVAAKVLFLFAFVFVPLLLAGVVLEVRAGASVFANAGALLEICLARSLWLILPALSLGVVTLNLLDFAGTCMALWVLLFLTGVREFGMDTILHAYRNPLQNAGIASVLPMTIAGIAAVGLQFAARHTLRSRGFIVAGVLLSGLLVSRDSVASFSLRITNPGFDPRQIQMAFDHGGPIRFERQRRSFCPALPLKVEGLAKNMILRGTGGTMDLNSRRAHSGGDAEIRETANGYSAVICPRSFFSVEPASLHATVHFEVIEVSPVATIPVKRGVLNAGGAGRCQVVEDVHTHFRCTLAEPVSGVLTAGLEYPGDRSFTKGFGDAGTFRLGPVLRQKFDGVSFETPAGWPLDAALKGDDARLVLRNERVIGSMSRTLVYEGFRIPWSELPLPPKPKPRGN